MISKPVIILMATFNGERYIKEQIESIIAQTYSNWLLYVSDDCSSDATIDIIKSYTMRDKRINLEVNHHNIGVVKNFNKLMLNHIDKGNYFMLSDQDDVWFNDKIERTICEMVACENSNQGSALVYCNRAIVDANLNFMNVPSLPESDSLHQVLSQNHLYGCTMMLNKALMESCIPIPSFVNTHDYWISLVASLQNCIHRIETPLMLYRVHSENVTGGINNYSLLQKVRNWNDTNLSIRFDLYQNLCFCVSFLGSTNSVTLRSYIEIFDKSGIFRLFEAINFGIVMHSFLATIRNYYNIVLMPNISQMKLEIITNSVK